MEIEKIEEKKKKVVLPLNKPIVPDLSKISNLYKQKNISNNEIVKDNKRVVSGKTISIANPSLNLIKYQKEEYDPARPNDYEELLAERKN